MTKRTGKARSIPEDRDSEANKNLYEILGVDSKASDIQIKQAYYQLALKCHPDRVGQTAESVSLFQQVGQAYEILSDQTRRQLYDETGSLSVEHTADWSAYFRELFHRVSFSDLDAFQQIYVGSAEETEDILAAYVKHRGDLTKITDSVFFGDVDSEDRYMQIIQRAIARGTVPTFGKMEKIVSDSAAFKAEQRKRRRRMEREAIEARELAKELGIDGSSDVSKMIQQRQKGRFDLMIANLEAKYAPANGKANKRLKPNQK